ncbi:hypothetical protein JTB14_001546 [Gonioctena quinquepunctata]|nr:hypothetical protein JTB14_001546 [Gonioctena quinquepunctata]
MDTRNSLHDNELADILTSEDFWADEEITIEYEADPSGSQCMSADDEMDATNIILLDGDKSEQGESDHELFSVHDTDSEDDESANENSNEENFAIDDDIEKTMGRRFFYGKLNKKNNGTKAGVDALDEKCANYIVSYTNLQDMEKKYLDIIIWRNLDQPFAINTSTQESTIVSFRAKFATQQRIFLEFNSRIAREPKKLRETKEGRDVASVPRRKTKKLAMFVEHVRNQYVSNAAVPCVQTV